MKKICLIFTIFCCTSLIFISKINAATQNVVTVRNYVIRPNSYYMGPIARANYNNMYLDVTYNTVTDGSRTTTFYGYRSAYGNIMNSAEKKTTIVPQACELVYVGNLGPGDWSFGNDTNAGWTGSIIMQSRS